jgi:hypothetical protein
VFLTRWVPAPERRTQPRGPGEQRPRPPMAPASRKKLVGYGMLGVGVVGLAEWFLRGRARIEAAAERAHTGELK